MYYITVSIIVILSGGYVSGECNHVLYTSPSVNAPIGECLLLYTMACTTIILSIDIVLPQDCKEWRYLGINKSDIYPVNPDDGEPFQVSYTLY